MRAAPAIALHGGAGVRPERDYARALAHLDGLVREAFGWLRAGAAAIDVVERAVAELEASGLYVAGRGSAPNLAGYVELDASIMDGARRRAGAVCAVRDLAQPVRAARLVLERTPHVLLAGDGALAFAQSEGLEIVADPARHYVLPAGVTLEDASGHGTVGAVARDGEGRLAAATSTGGVFGKRAGRVGDTPLVGAGVWADEDIAISCTGVGEAFVLAGGARDVAARMRYAGAAPEAAAEALLAEVAARGGDGGLIAVTRAGKLVFACNSQGMKRAGAAEGVAPFASL